MLITKVDVASAESLSIFNFFGKFPLDRMVCDDDVRFSDFRKLFDFAFCSSSFLLSAIFFYFSTKFNLFETFALCKEYKSFILLFLKIEGRPALTCTRSCQSVSCLFL